MGGGAPRLPRLGVHPGRFKLIPTPPYHVNRAYWILLRRRGDKPRIRGGMRATGDESSAQSCPGFPTRRITRPPRSGSRRGRGPGSTRNARFGRIGAGARRPNAAACCSIWRPSSRKPSRELLPPAGSPTSRDGAPAVASGRRRRQSGTRRRPEGPGSRGRRVLGHRPPALRHLRRITIPAPRTVPIPVGPAETCPILRVDPVLSFAGESFRNRVRLHHRDVQPRIGRRPRRDLRRRRHPVARVHLPLPDP